MTPAPRAERPQEGEITSAECARRLGISAQALGLWTKRPGAPVRIAGRRVYCVWPSFARWREQELCKQAVAEATKAYRESKEDGADRDPFRRKAEADARKAEIEVEVLEKSFVAVDEAAALFESVLTNARAVLMPFARVVAPKLVACDNIVEMEQVVHKEMVRLMQQLASPELVPALPIVEDRAA